MDFSISSRLSPDGTTVARLNGPTVDLIDSRTGERRTGASHRSRLQRRSVVQRRWTAICGQRR